MDTIQMTGKRNRLVDMDKVVIEENLLDFLKTFLYGEIEDLDFIQKIYTSKLLEKCAKDIV